MVETDRRSSLQVFWRYAIGVSVLWTVLVLSSLAWNTAINKRQGQQLLHKEAHANYNKDNAFRLWGTRHGGVYVPVTEETPPSPYMAQIPERDITTPSGTKLTLMNPAYMTRQLMEDYEKEYGIRGKITGLVLLRAENAPDDWERQALLKLKAGAEEVSETSVINGIPHLRMMHPLYMEPGCDKCHGHLGFKTGDFRGGVSIAVPATPYIKANQETFISLVKTHTLAWLLGLIGIALTGRQIHRQIKVDIEVETELSRSRRRLSEILRISPSAILTTTSDGIVTQFNEGATKIFGYASDEIVGRPVSTLIPEKYRRQHGKYLKDFAEADHSSLNMGERTSIEGRRKDGTIFPAGASVSKLRVGEETYFTVALLDLTEQVRREQELLEARDLAEVASRSKSEFLANMSHEIRTPLTATKGMLELIDTSALDDKDRRYIQVANDASDAVIAILNDILDLARLEAGRTDLDLTTFELHRFTDDLCQLMRGAVEQKGLELTCDFAVHDPVWVTADIQRLRQILINLIGNATKFTEQGEIRLALKVEQGNTEGSLGIEFSVSDTGIGIPEQDLPRLFDRFEQQDSTPSRKHQGAGLGLSICRELTSLMNGTIHAKSEFGSGSTFIVNITCQSAENSSHQDSGENEPVARKASLHVLVAEDNKVNQLLASEFLRRLGHTYKIVANGQEAIDAFMNAPSAAAFDVILMDVQMPVMDGLEATRFIRSQTERPDDIPIIALTADAMNQHQDKYREIGMTGFIAKPYSISDLEAELARALPKTPDASTGGPALDTLAS